MAEAGSHTLEDRRRLTASPVEWLRDEDAVSVNEDGIGLCLSGGGYRAMLFHLGALWRLHRGGYLDRVTLVSSVSGGSIVAAVLGMNWARLDRSASAEQRAASFERWVVDPILALASKTVDVRAGVAGLLLPGRAIGDELRRSYDSHLFGGCGSDALGGGDPDAPLFVINATHLQTGALWRFSQRGSWDRQVGFSSKPASLAEAVAASSAFPPILGPVRRRLAAGYFDPEGAPPIGSLDAAALVANRGLRRHSVLVDGGVYDNLGLEAPWKSCRTVLISDAGGAYEADDGTFWKFPWWRWRDWGTQTMRVLKTIDNQVRELRKHQAILGFEDEHGEDFRRGTYWGIRSHLEDYGLADPLPFSQQRAEELAATPTRLRKLPSTLRHELVRWGYVACDTATRRWVTTTEPQPDWVPYS